VIENEDAIMAKYLAGEWIPCAIVDQCESLRKRMAEHAAVWSVAKDAYKIKIAFAVSP
jgi:hypothetical protein